MTTVQNADSYLDVLSECFEHVPVSPRTFVEGPDYLGSMVGELHDRWKDELDFVLDPTSQVTEWILTGSIGCGKSTVAAIAEVYKVYCLSCLREPATFYGLLPGSKIVFGVFSITLSKADKGYELMKQYISGCPYFQQHCPPRLRPADPINLPRKSIEVQTGSLADHALSENMFGFMLDEANFFKKSQMVADETDRTRAHQLYKQAKRRQESRFQRYGVTPGLNCLVSSKKTQTEFLEERMERMGKDPTVHVTSLSLWDAKPSTNYCGRKFFVMIGDGRLSSRILDDEEIAPKGYEVVEVPTEHKKAFEEDADDALRDLAGKAVTGSGYFFSRRELLHNCVDRSRSHPFTRHVLTDISLQGDALLEDYFRVEALFHTVESRSTLRVHPGIQRVAHVDIGLTGDSLGLAIGHLTPEGRICYDVLLRVKPPIGSEIDLDAPIQFFRFLWRHGMSFAIICYDSFQSRHSLQHLIKFGAKAELASPGLQEYIDFRSHVYAGAVIYYDYEPLLQEMVEMVKDPRGGAPDHPAGGSKDVLDATVSVFAKLQENLREKSARARKRHEVLLPLVGSGRRR